MHTHPLRELALVLVWKNRGGGWIRPQTNPYLRTAQGTPLEPWIIYFTQVKLFALQGSYVSMFVWILYILKNVFSSFSADSLTVESLLELLDEDSLRKDTALPSPEWSSDHIALLAEFRCMPKTRR